eukprot:59502-Rhodomonas_salina.2
MEGGVDPFMSAGKLPRRSEDTKRTRRDVVGRGKLPRRSENALRTLGEVVDHTEEVNSEDSQVEIVSPNVYGTGVVNPSRSQADPQCWRVYERLNRGAVRNTLFVAEVVLELIVLIDGRQRPAYPGARVGELATNEAGEPKENLQYLWRPRYTCTRFFRKARLVRRLTNTQQSEKYVRTRVEHPQYKGIVATILEGVPLRCWKQKRDRNGEETESRSDGLFRHRRGRVSLAQLLSTRRLLPADIYSQAPNSNLARYHRPGYAGVAFLPSQSTFESTRKTRG